MSGGESKDSREKREMKKNSTRKAEAQTPVTSEIQKWILRSRKAPNLGVDRLHWQGLLQLEKKARGADRILEKT